ncbi:dihydroxyacetone kinase subunit DhaL [Marispirochaeta sp.]|uniref:dihydroxyacetone kinase subunit DhaL n=1 Tax=Marispirochaeta sp. TaxID=2038653 RepID=UPI0029C96EA0|nr:dihydroxyacetone kinase subunit DhaL [Marispirochaeta sp.]
MAKVFAASRGRIVVERLIRTVHENRSYLSEIDGKIGDGDHGINMDKGFSIVEKELAGREIGISEAFQILGHVLIDEIGGSMGPLYGTFFKRMARTCRDEAQVDTRVLQSMLIAAYEGIQQLGNAKVGDKTLVDTLSPAVVAVKNAVTAGKSFEMTVDDMIAAAENGWKSTKDLIAKVGRASRLGERSLGVLDAGATSCYLLLKSMGETMKEFAI